MRLIDSINNLAKEIANNSMSTKWYSAVLATEADNPAEVLQKGGSFLIIDAGDEIVAEIRLNSITVNEHYAFQFIQLYNVPDFHFNIFLNGEYRRSIYPNILTRDDLHKLVAITDDEIPHCEYIKITESNRQSIYTLTDIRYIRGVLLAKNDETYVRELFEQMKNLQYVWIEDECIEYSRTDVCNCDYLLRIAILSSSTLGRRKCVPNIGKYH